MNQKKLYTRLYDFSMNQILKLKDFVSFLTENGYMLIILLIKGF